MSFLEALVGYAGRLKIGDVTVDASISETHMREADITDHPVEEGSDITDHYRARPRSLQLDGRVTSTPIETGFPGQTAINAVVSTVKGDDPVKTAWDTFNGYVDEGTLVTVSTSLDEYPNVGITNFSAFRDASRGQVLDFSCSIKQLRIVSTLEAAAIKIAKETAAGKGKESKGKKPPQESTSSQNQSAAAKLLDKGASFFS
jgi:hypothetical protein